LGVSTGTEGGQMNEDFDLKAIGSRMKKVRTRLHKTQAEMAQVLEISLSHYSKLEVGIGGISHGLIHKFCTAFNVDQPWFVYGKGNDPDCIIVSKPKTSELEHEAICQIVELVLNKDVQKMAETFSEQFKVDFIHSMAMMVKELLKCQEQQAEDEQQKRQLAEQQARKEFLSKSKGGAASQGRSSRRDN